MNLVILKGRLTRDPEVAYTQSGKCVASFTVAVDRPGRRNAENAAVQMTDFIPCVAWEKQAEFVGNYFGKGKEILVDGAMQVRAYTTKDGGTRYATEVKVNHIEFCGSKASSESYGNDAPLPQEEFPGSANSKPSDDDIPF